MGGAKHDPDVVAGYVLDTGGASIQLGDDPRFSAIPVSSLWEITEPS